MSPSKSYYDERGNLVWSETTSQTGEGFTIFPGSQPSFYNNYLATDDRTPKERQSDEQAQMAQDIKRCSNVPIHTVVEYDDFGNRQVHQTFGGTFTPQPPEYRKRR